MRTVHPVVILGMLFFGGAAIAAGTGTWVNIPGGGVTANSCSGGTFANAISANGTLSCGTPAGGSPGGNNMDVQFNNGGSFGGSDSFTFDGTNTFLAGVDTSNAAETNFILNVNAPAPTPSYSGTPPSPVQAIDLTSDTLNDGVQRPSLNWNMRTASRAEGSVSVDWENEILVDGSGTPADNWGARYLYDTNGTLSEDYGGRQLVDNGATSSIDWNGRNLLNTGGGLSLNYGSGVSIYDSSGVMAFASNARSLYDSSGTAEFSWTASGVQIPKKVSSLAGVSTAGTVGVPPVYGTVSLQAQGASISTTTLYNPAASGEYRVNIYTNCSTAGTAGDTLTVTISFNDGFSSQTITAVNAMSLSTVHTFANYVGYMHANVGTAIQYATTVSSVAGSPKYAIYISLERLN